MIISLECIKEKSNLIKTDNVFLIQLFNSLNFKLFKLLIIYYSTFYNILKLKIYIDTKQITNDYSQELKLLQDYINITRNNYDW